MEPWRDSMAGLSLSEALPMQSTESAPFGLENVISVLFKSTKLGYNDLKALRLVSKAVKAATHPCIKEITVPAEDLNFLSTSILASTVSTITLDFSNLPNTAQNTQAVLKFCSSSNAPNLAELNLIGIAHAALPHLSHAKWPSLKTLDIQVSQFDTKIHVQDHLKAWRSAAWPLTSLSLSFQEDDAPNLILNSVVHILPSFPSLGKISLDHISLKAAQRITAAKLQQLRVLELRCLEDHKGGVAETLSKANFPHLKFFGLTYPNFNPGELHTFTKASWFQPLKALELKECMLSRDETKLLLQALQRSGEILHLTLEVQHKAVFEFSGISLPLLYELRLIIKSRRNFHSIAGADPICLDNHLKALFVGSDLPKLNTLFFVPDYMRSCWLNPPAVTAQSPKILPSLEVLALGPFGMSNSCLEFLGRHFVSRGLKQIVVDSVRVCQDPLGHILDGVVNNMDCDDLPVIQRLCLKFPPLPGAFENLVQYLTNFPQLEFLFLQAYQQSIPEPEVRLCGKIANRPNVEFQFELTSAEMYDIQATADYFEVETIEFLQGYGDVPTALMRMFLENRHPNAVVIVHEAEGVEAPGQMSAEELAFDEMMRNRFK